MNSSNYIHSIDRQLYDKINSGFRNEFQFQRSKFECRHKQNSIVAKMLFNIHEICAVFHLIGAESSQKLGIMAEDRASLPPKCLSIKRFSAARTFPLFRDFFLRQFFFALIAIEMFS